MILTPALGYKPDQNLFAAWARAFREFGMAGFFERVDFCNYPPFTLLILWTTGHVVGWFDQALAHETLLRALLKLPACLADAAIAGVLYSEGRRLFGVARAVGAAALYYLNPVSLYNSAFWGQVDAIHSFFLLAGLVLVLRNRWTWAGAAAGLAFAQKFQSIALLPLIIFELYRRGRWPAVGRGAWGAAAITAVIWAPFASKNVLDDVLRRGYVSVVGQYPDLSQNAYNLWYLVSSPEIPDTSVPPPLARIAAAGRVEFPDHGSWPMWFTWRRISLILYSICVAVVLSVYSRRPEPIAGFGAAGLLGLVFFLIPTEMHERYALPAFAFLALWAVAGPWQERIFFLLSVLVTLNMTTVLGIAEAAPHVAAMLLLLALVTGIAVAVPTCLAAETDSETRQPTGLIEKALPPSRLIAWFRLASVGSCGLLLVMLVLGALFAQLAAPLRAWENSLYLSSLTPQQVTQGWGELRKDRSVSGGLLHIGEKIYLRGLGTHAKSRITYDLPEGYDFFEAAVGINRSTGKKGSATVAVELDGDVLSVPAVLKGSNEPVFVRLPLGKARRLTLRADTTEDGNKSDHVDWGLARLVREDGSEATP